MVSRRSFLSNTAGALVTAGVISRVNAQSVPEAPLMGSAATQPPPMPTTGRPFKPVVTLNGWSLPWRMQGDVKEFHLVAEPVEREVAPGMTAHLWGYNGQSPGPTIECVEGDRVRIFVTNKLPEITTVHWHGVHVPNGMDGVAGLTQPPIKPGDTWVYEFDMQRAGTFMYHPHADGMVQFAMGMMGTIIVHPEDLAMHEVDRDFVFLLNAYDIEPGSYTPRVSTMTDFNLWTFNSRAFPGISPMVVRQGDRVRIRVGNLTMTNHPIHLHGHSFEVTGTDGGWVPETARWPEATIDIGVGQMRAIEFIADAPGDWAFHCHKTHHAMNAMAHDVPTSIGVDFEEAAVKLRRLIPEYMVMGDRGMAEMTEMKMELPENTLPMMAGDGPHGSIGMGGMFTTFKVRVEQPPDDYSDPGWYEPPAGSTAHRQDSES
ncbi:MAG: copper oxidase [Arenicellaceae bacterium]|nr:copper oxidase [Arenicellaceae bacterium]